MSPTKTSAERQREFRARMAEQGLAEVRGIFARLEDHRAVKEAAAKTIERRRAKGGKPAG
jgi:hypothetical protein